MAPQTPATSHLILDEAAAVRVWNWILTRQGLADARRLTSAQQVADAALGLHAARLPSPYGIVASRTADPSVPATLFTAPVRAALITVRCMRKTLHTLPLDLAGVAHVATLRFRERDALRAVRNAGYLPGVIDQLTAQLCALLAEGPLPYRGIEAALERAGNERRAARLAVKLAWERGIIAYLNTTSAWNREQRSFALTAAAYPALDLSHSRAHAVTALVTAYFHRYGPATIGDAAWWSGLAAADISTALHASGRELMTVAAPWSQQPCFMFADQAQAALASESATGVQLLAHEDTALKVYHQSRGRYLAGLPQRYAFNQIGEALPAIVIDGRIAGTWSWDPRARSVRTYPIRGRTTPTERRQIHARAAVLTGTLRSAWATPALRERHAQDPITLLPRLASARVTTQTDPAGHAR